MKVIDSEKFPIKMWLEDIEDGAVAQLKNLANLPFAFKHVAVMPDCHQGYGMPIGGVLATVGIIIPNAVGVDIGCGMCAIKTSVRVDDMNVELLKKIFGGSSDNHGGIRSAIPVGFNHQSKKQSESLMH
jgi:tRNA-splicing ligase RtcB (3'-phosphate/5'-hydroxy nucleic acid ligase)